jgi:Ni/Co efflux regulator RcnB
MMKTTFKAALAAVLLAGVAGQALAQEHDHDRWVRPGGGGPPAPARPAAPAAPPAPAAPAAPAQAPMGGHGRLGGPPGAGAPAPGFAPQADRGPQNGGPRNGGQRFGRDGAQGDGSRRWDRGGPQTPGVPRQFDHQRGPNEVIPPGAERGWDGRRDGHQTGPGIDARNGRDGRWDGRGTVDPRGRDGRPDGRGGDPRDGRWAGRGGDGRDGHWDGRGSDNRNGQHWGRGERWERGRFPPVFWSQQRFRIGGYRAPHGYYSRAWAFGDFLPRGWYGQDYWLDDFLDYDLPYPPPGFEWVRVGDDAVLVDQYSGQVVQVVRGIFW